jgi:hypothetical protein
VPDQPRRLFDLRAWKPADRLDGLGRVLPAQAGIELESRMADDLAAACADAVFAVKARLAVLPSYCPVPVSYGTSRAAL